MLNKPYTTRAQITSPFLVDVLIVVCIFVTAWTNPAHALTLVDAIEQALHNDPTYLAAQANADASRARSSQAFARLMPQLTASANTNDNRRDYFILSNRGNTLPERYNSHGTQVNFTQPLLHAEKYFALNQAGLLVNQADYQFAAAEKDLLMRFAQAWLDIRQARDVVTAADSRLQASQKEFDLARRALEKGVMSVAELEAAQAKRDQAQSEQVTAQTEHSLKLAVLEQIIGSSDTPVSSVLSNRFSSLEPDQSTPEQWIAQAENGSPSILAARRALDAAHQEVSRQRAGHLPTLDLIASYNNATQGYGLTGGQAGFRSTVNSVGVQLNLPLFSGGEQNAKVSEALAMRDKASYELEATRRTTHLKIKQAWLTLKSSQARQQSGKQSVKSASIALKSAEAQRAHGLKADLDVLQARQQRDEVLRDWNKARNDAVLNYLKLLAETGQLTGLDVLGMERKDSSVLPDEGLSTAVIEAHLQ
ncbi:MAG: TolC family outer membrane protein [Gallionella sp.]|jgi:outer membrane protein